MATITVEQLRQALETVGPFPVATYVAQLQERARNLGDLSFLKGSLGIGLSQESILNGDHLTSNDAQALITTLAHATTASSLAAMVPGDDPYNFRGCIDGPMAKATGIDALTRLTGYCFADHIDAHLVSRGLPKLATLQKDAAFVEAYQTMFLQPDTIEAQIERDLTVHNIAYSSSMLFVSNFFQHQATPALHEPSRIWLKAFGQIVQAKIMAAVKSQATDRAAKLTVLVVMMCKALPVTYAMQSGDAKSTLLRPPTTGEILEPLAGMNVPDNVKAEIERLKSKDLKLGDWKTYGELLSKLWDDVASVYTGAVRTATKAQTVHYEDSPFADQWVEGDALSPPIMTTTTGQGTAEWINRARSSYPELILKQAPHNWTRAYTRTPGSCFIAGTKIFTRSGSKNIEDLQEFDWVLTRGEFDEWGLVSDEKVAIPVEIPTIHGFNEEKPFFTAGHVFFTTTGLRALNPTLAMKENPWADIGRLSVGNIVMRLNRETKQYEQVIVQSISSEAMPDIKQVYGIHLREGRRSYHANGYLVAVNYPEITMKSICKMMRTIPVDEQARLLLAFNELRPLFERFGIGGISDALKAEVETESAKNSMRLYKTRRDKLTGPGHGSFQYPPEEIVGFDYSGLLTPLPTVSVLEGVVFVNGVACQQASISNMKNEIRWTRDLSQDASSQGPFEHGRLVVHTLSCSAQGDIIYSKDPGAKDLFSTGFIQFMAMAEDLSSLPSYEEALAAAVPVSPPSFDEAVAAPAPAPVAEPQPSFDLAEDEVTPTPVPEPEPSFDPEDESKLHPPATINPPIPDDSTRGTRPRPRAVMATSGPAPGAEGTTKVDKDPLFLPAELPAPVLRPLRFNMVYDVNKFKTNQITPKDPSDLVDFGFLDMTTARDGPTGLTIRKAMLPDLDILHKLISEKYGNENVGRLDTFYTSTIGLDEQGRTVIGIKIDPTAQELLKVFRDVKTDEDDDSLVWTFKTNLQTEVKLGMMFASIEATLGADSKTAMGIISEFSSDSDTGAGTRHLFISNPSDSAVRIEIEKRLEGSINAGNIPTGTPTTPVSTPQNPPPTPPREGPLGTYHVNTLAHIPYKNEDLDKKAKRILQDIMFFHMNQSDLNEVLSKNAPRDLPQHLAEGLPGDLRNWIRDVYSPAFTALQVAESLNVKDWVSRFTAKERAKILFFWQGDKKGCLSQSVEYKILNKMAVREAMVQLYKVLTQFVSDGGPEWAEKFYAELQKSELGNTVVAVSSNDQTALEKYCNILYVLAPETSYARKFYEDVVKQSAVATMVQPRRLNDDLEVPWLTDACKWMADALLDPSSQDIDKQTKDAFMKDWEQFCKDQKLEFDRTNRKQMADNLLAQIRIAAIAPKAVAGMTIMAKGLWYRSSTQVQGRSWLNENGISKPGSAVSTFLKVGALIFTTINMYFQMEKVNLEPAEIGRVAATVSKNFFDLVSPHFAIRQERSFFQQRTELQILNDKIKKTPFGYKQDKLIKERTKWFDQLGDDALKIKKNAESTSFLKKLQNKVSVPAKAIRLFGVVIAIAYIGFLIWDLAVNGGKMSGVQLALNILNLIIEVAIVVLEIVAIAMPALSIIPVIGQVFAVLLLIASIFLSIFGGSERQKTPGELFVERMQAPGGWLSKIPEPPTPLLTSTMTPESGTKGASTTFTFTLTNSTSKAIKFTEATKYIPGEDASTDTINSVEVNFFAGSDPSTVFSTVNFSGPTTTTTSPSSSIPWGSGTWSVTTPNSSAAAAWRVDLQKPNGTNFQSTGFQLRIKASDNNTPSLAVGEKIVVTVQGTLGAEAGTALVKVVEKRPGAEFCPATFLVTRN